jgi:hypothetical protein
MHSLALQKLLQQSDLDRDQSNQAQNKFIMNHLGIPPSGPLGLMAIKPRRKVFVSYHHAPLDQIYRDEFEKMFARLNGVFISKSVQIGDINPNLTVETIRSKIRDEYLRDSTVTVVLIGPNTWQRKHVDWEISSSIRQTALSSRSGLLGILLTKKSAPQSITDHKAVDQAARRMLPQDKHGPDIIDLISL